MVQVSLAAWSHRVVEIMWVAHGHILKLYVWESMLLARRKEDLNAQSLLRQIEEGVKSTIHRDEMFLGAERGPPRRLLDLSDECLEQILEGVSCKTSISSSAHPASLGVANSV